MEAWRQLLLRLLMAVRATPLQSHSQITELFRLEKTSKMLCNYVFGKRTQLSKFNLLSLLLVHFTQTPTLTIKTFLLQPVPPHLHTKCSCKIKHFIFRKALPAQPLERWAVPVTSDLAKIKESVSTSGFRKWWLKTRESRPSISPIGPTVPLKCILPLWTHSALQSPNAQRTTGQQRHVFQHSLWAAAGEQMDYLSRLQHGKDPVPLCQGRRTLLPIRVVPDKPQ